MTTITGRLKLLSTEESHKAGNYDAETLLAAFRKANEEDDAASLLADTLNGIMALAFDNRTEESIERLDGFCAIIGPVLERAAALEAKCALLAEPGRSSSRDQDRRTARRGCGHCHLQPSISRQDHRCPTE